MFDSIIIGSGISGLRCGIFLKESGLNIAIISKTYPTKSQSCMAQGGINGANTDEEINQHIQDTISAGKANTNQNSIQKMCTEIKDEIHWLDKIGVVFSRDLKNNIAKRRLGATKYPLANYAQDYTGLKIIHTLYDYSLKNNIKFFNEYFVIEIKKENDYFIIEAIEIKTSQVYNFYSKTVVIATGGYAKIYGSNSTNSAYATGDGIVLAKKIGCNISNIEMVQFHPTATIKNSVLISESARGEGAYLIDQNGKRFIDELLPRDIVSRELHKKINNGEKVFLDLRHLGEDFINTTLPQEKKLAKIFENIDITKEILEIKPAAHYSIGGIETDEFAQTNIKGIFACGECSFNGVHGTNRLGGNSLSEAVVFGKIAAISVVEYLSKNSINSTKETTLSSNKIIEELFLNEQINFYPLSQKLSELMFKNVGIIKNEKDLNEVLEFIFSTKELLKNRGIEDKNKIFNTNLINFLEFLNILEISQDLIIAAINNRKNVGAHFRSDI